MDGGAGYMPFQKKRQILNLKVSVRISQTNHRQTITLLTLSSLAEEGREDMN